MQTAAFVFLFSGLAQAGQGHVLLSDMGLYEQPTTIDQHAWVHASSSNLTDNIVRGLFDQDYPYYAFPSKFLDANFNVFYTNGSSEVFHR